MTEYTLDSRGKDIRGSFWNFHVVHDGIYTKFMIEDSRFMEEYTRGSWWSILEVHGKKYSRFMVEYTRD